MKSPMHELIEKLVNMSNSTYFNGKKSDCDIIDKIKDIVRHEFLEKEKQQIIDAGNKCAFKQHLHEVKINKMTNDELLKFAEQKTDTFGEEYYNETFS